MSKKGVSEVVTAILLILIAIAAVIIVWSAVIKPLVERQSSGGKIACLTVDLEITAYDEANNKVTVKRGAGEGNVQSLLIAVSDGTEAKTTSVGGIGALETKTFTVTNLPAGSWKSVEVAANVGEAGKTPETCENSVTYTIS